TVPHTAIGARVPQAVTSTGITLRSRKISPALIAAPSGASMAPRAHPVRARIQLRTPPGGHLAPVVRPCAAAPPLGGVTVRAGPAHVAGGKGGGGGGGPGGRLVIPAPPKPPQFPRGAAGSIRPAAEVDGGRVRAADHHGQRLARCGPVAAGHGGGQGRPPAG